MNKKTITGGIDTVNERASCKDCDDCDCVKVDGDHHDYYPRRIEVMSESDLKTYRELPPAKPYPKAPELAYDSGFDSVMDNGSIRKFGTGATRDTNTNKPEFGGFLSVMVLREFGRYMHKNRKQSDGQLRDSDNWKKGMPRRVYAESLIRHTLDVVGEITGDDEETRSVQEVLDALMAIIFNAQGLARELLLDRSC